MGGKPRPNKNTQASLPLTERNKTKSKSGGEDDQGDHASLMVESKRRYLNYAFSVITARALPDVRDGLKPVQRRILYAMFHDEHLYPDSKHRKSAKVVGAVIGKYHPHGDTAVYDAMVRMAQWFSLRMPLVDGSGNFGSLDGDSAAAYRYTECRMAPPAMELLREIRQETVPFRSNFDGTAEEPIVLPARIPNLLINGSTGIAVGMATNIPPHNVKEITDALIALVDDRALTTTNILKYIKGPDFPTGGQILNSKVELRQIYESGTGPVRIRAEYKTEKQKRGTPNIIITSVPYTVNKSTLIEKIADVIIQRKLPYLVDVRDESTEDVRIVLETKKDANLEMVMAYLFKHTPLQLSFNVNLTCLIPTENPEVGQPLRMGLKPMLEHFLDFRFEVTQKRFEFELRALLKRIHILQGFITIFDALDETIKIIRKSDGRKDAAAKLIVRFKLDQMQVDAILELRLYKLAKLEINIIREELEQKSKESKRIQTILKSKSKLWGVVKTDLKEAAAEFNTQRLTKTGGVKEIAEFGEEEYIVDEDAHVVVTKDGWIKRMREVKDPTSTRLREGDSVLAVLPGSTKENVVFFTSAGSAYVSRINDIPATTGYGDPAQKLFKFKDKERIIFAISLDPRLSVPDEMLAISKEGFGMRFSVEQHSAVSTRTGRRYAKPSKTDEMVAVVPVSDTDVVITATQKGHSLLCMAEEINKLEGPGKGVRIIKVAEGDKVIGLAAGRGRKDTLKLQTGKGGKKIEVTADPKKAVTRGGKGKQLVKRSQLALSPSVVEIPELGEEE